MDIRRECSAHRANKGKERLTSKGAPLIFQDAMVGPLCTVHQVQLRQSQRHDRAHVGMTHDQHRPWTRHIYLEKGELGLGARRCT